MRGVILDMASLGPRDLRLDGLMHQLEDWDLHAASTADEVPARIAGAEVVLANKSRIDAAALAGAGRLGLVAVMATGTNNIDLRAAAARGIVVCNARNYAADSVAEHTLMLMLALARRLGPYREAVAAGAWSRSEHFCLHLEPLMELRGSRLGIVGYGDLGRAVAALATAFGMQVALAELPGRRHATAPHPRMPFGELLAWCDVLSLHCPLDATTRGLVGAAELARMRPGALLVNVARGGIVDERALLDALGRGHLGGAAIDTLEVEPPPADALLPAARVPNLIVTPHVAWASRVARQHLVDQLADVIRAWRAGAPVNVVGPG